MDDLAGRYRISGTKDKGVVLNEILKKLEEGDQNRYRIDRISRNPAYRIAISTAASMVLILLLHFLLSVTRLENDTAQAQAIRLPDHSRVILSKNSTMSHPKYWWKREVKLEGDAYFEVEKGKKFIVKTKEGDVSVMGTRFQVSGTGDGVTVTCYEGIVGLTCKEYNQVICAGLTLEYRNNKDAGLKPIQWEYPELALFKQDFSGEDLQQVTAALEDFFQIRILLATTGSKRFSGNLETAKAETAVRIICRSLDLSYTINSNRNIIINDKK